MRRRTRFAHPSKRNASPCRRARQTTRTQSRCPAATSLDASRALAPPPPTSQAPRLRSLAVHTAVLILLVDAQGLATPLKAQIKPAVLAQARPAASGAVVRTLLAVGADHAAPAAQHLALHVPLAVRATLGDSAPLLALVLLTAVRADVLAPAAIFAPAGSAPVDALAAHTVRHLARDFVVVVKASERHGPPQLS
jgi:hypothetical protein